ncbi:MAG: hypothetical protein IT168_05955 [Bryobacterales bacterium]|nr:hypothetical protein [Bryobacterales bacterium]
MDFQTRHDAFAGVLSELPRTTRAEQSAIDRAIFLKKTNPSLDSVGAVAQAYISNPSLYDAYLEANPAQRGAR